MRGIDLAEEDWERHQEGANIIYPGGTFSDSALALPPGRGTTSASWPSRPRGSTPPSPLSVGPRMKCF